MGQWEIFSPISLIGSVLVDVTRISIRYWPLVAAAGQNCVWGSDQHPLAFRAARRRGRWPEDSDGIERLPT